MSQNKKRFFYNGILLSIVAIATRSVGMFFNAYITRTVGAEGIGLYTLIMTVYSFAITFATSGISLTTTRLVASAIGEEDGKGVFKIMRHGVIYSLIFSISASSVLFAFARYFAVHAIFDTRAVAPLRILALSLVPISLASLFGGYFVGVRRVARNAVVQVAGQGFKIALTLFVVLRFASWGAGAAVLALAASTTLTELFAFLVSFALYLLDRRRKLPTKAERPRRFSDVAGMALPLAVSAYIRSALLTLEHVLIPKRLTRGGSSHEEALAHYGILHGMTLPILTYPMSPLSSFAGLLVPEFAASLARGEEARMKRIADEALNMTLSYASVLTVFLAVFAEEIGYVIYNSYDTGYYIALMAPVIPIMYLDHVTDSVLKGIGEHVYSMWVNIADSLLSVVLVWILIPIMGISGYAVVIVAMEAFNFLLSALRLRSKIKFHINLVPSFLLPTVCATLGAALMRRLFTLCGAEASAPLLALKLVFALSATVALYLPMRSLFSALKRKGKIQIRR